MDILNKRFYRVPKSVREKFSFKVDPAVDALALKTLAVKTFRGSTDASLMISDIKVALSLVTLGMGVEVLVFKVGSEDVPESRYQLNPNSENVSHDLFDILQANRESEFKFLVKSEVSSDAESKVAEMEQYSKDTVNAIAGGKKLDLDFVSKSPVGLLSMSTEVISKEVIMNGKNVTLYMGTAYMHNLFTIFLCKERQCSEATNPATF